MSKGGGRTAQGRSNQDSARNASTQPRLLSSFSDKPSVVLRMDPASPVSELDRLNVTLFCDVEAGNPLALDSVRWYFGGDLLKQLPLCDDEGIEQGLCDIDPSKLLLEHVSKQFHGNFSCQGSNGAGWSRMAKPQQLEIYCEYMRWSFVIFAAQASYVRISDVRKSFSYVERARARRFARPPPSPPFFLPFKCRCGRQRAQHLLCPNDSGFISKRARSRNGAKWRYYLFLILFNVRNTIAERHAFSLTLWLCSASDIGFILHSSVRTDSYMQLSPAD